MIDRKYAVIVCALLGACGTLASSQPSAAGAHLELSLAREDGRSFKLSALDGQPRLLFLFATYDQASQLALAPLSRFVEQNPDTAVLGVLVQPEAETFMPMFAHSLSLPFELYVEPDNRLLEGKTPLGRLEVVPAFVALDARGKIRDVRYGIATDADLRSMLDNAR